MKWKSYLLRTYLEKGNPTLKFAGLVADPKPIENNVVSIAGFQFQV